MCIYLITINPTKQTSIKIDLDIHLLTYLNDIQIRRELRKDLEREFIKFELLTYLQRLLEAVLILAKITTTILSLGAFR